MKDINDNKVEYRSQAEGCSNLSGGNKEVRNLFDTIAWKYDLMNDLLSFGLHRTWKKWMVSRAIWCSDPYVLDVCCGTGDVALMLLQAGARVVGIDFSPEMLRIAHRRVRRLVEKTGCRQLSERIKLLQADASQLPFDDRSFDSLTIAYGLRNLSSPLDALAELVRVVRTGGRLVILDFALPRGTIWRLAYVAYLAWLVPFFGGSLTGRWGAYRYIYDSLCRYPPPEMITRRLVELGAREVLVERLLFGGMTLHTAVF